MPTSAPSDLVRRSYLGLAQFMVFLAVVLFASAWTLSWWQAWVFWAVFGAACFVITLALLRSDPALVERRLRAGPTAEREASQKLIQTGTVLVLAATFLTPALDHRFGWSSVPPAVSVAGNVMVIVGFWMIYRVFRANSFASSTVEVSSDQTVISTGPYGIVRHPMYSASLLLFAGIPLALGSWWGLIPASLIIPLLVARLLAEEEFLVRSLAGYSDYRKRVRWRLLPLIW
ncbi:MAG TPA: isoprenylcysteine carboxylmethyltransferase family protein [Hyphomonadaceae bacterium]|nr:isoprenylcysteine carboxylmethyltransferase family protein [Hyphomonadaceae bacterium]